MRVTTLDRELRPGFILERFEIDNGAGARISGQLLLPRDVAPGQRCPAILYHHWHGDQYDVGTRSLFERAYTPVEPGPDLVRRGYVVMAIDAYGFGARSGQGPGGPLERGRDEEQSASKFNLWVGRTLWGMIVRDDRIALDYLLLRPEVDPHRVGATGMSMGATRTWWLMAVDDRISAGVAVACMTRYRDLVEAQKLSAHGIYYFVPGVLRYFDTEAIIACIAPRPLLFLTGDRDDGSPVRGIRTIASTVRRVYALHNASTQFRSRVYPGVGHEYTAAMWQETVAWMGKNLEELERRS